MPKSRRPRGPTRARKSGSRKTATRRTGGPKSAARKTEAHKFAERKTASRKTATPRTAARKTAARSAAAVRAWLCVQQIGEAPAHRHVREEFEIVGALRQLARQPASLQFADMVLIDPCDGFGAQD